MSFLKIQPPSTQNLLYHASRHQFSLQILKGMIFGDACIIIKDEPNEYLKRFYEKPLTLIPTLPVLCCVFTAQISYSFCLFDSNPVPI